MKSSLPLDCCYLSVFPFDELWREAIQQRGKKTGVLSGWLKLVWPSRQEASCAPLKRLQIKADGRRQSDENVYYLQSDGGCCSQEAAKKYLSFVLRWLQKCQMSANKWSQKIIRDLKKKVVCSNEMGKKKNFFST